MSEINENYPFSKDLIKKALSVNFVKKYLAENFDVFKWSDFYQLKLENEDRKIFYGVEKKRFHDWTDKNCLDVSRIFTDAFLKVVDDLQLNNSFLVELADGIKWCFNNYSKRNTFVELFDSILSGLQPTDPFGEAFGAKGFYCYVAYMHQPKCPHIYHFSNKKEVVLDFGLDNYKIERDYMSEKDWQEYFPDEDLDEVFGFKREDDG